MTTVTFTPGNNKCCAYCCKKTGPYLMFGVQSRSDAMCNLFVKFGDVLDIYVLGLWHCLYLFRPFHECDLQPRQIMKHSAIDRSLTTFQSFLLRQCLRLSTFQPLTRLGLKTRQLFSCRLFVHKGWFWHTWEAAKTGFEGYGLSHKFW